MNPDQSDDDAPSHHSIPQENQLENDEMEEDEMLQAAIAASLSRPQHENQGEALMRQADQEIFTFASNRRPRPFRPVQDSDDEDLVDAMVQHMDHHPSTPSPPPELQGLHWQRQFDLIQIGNLTGDKISLPPSALDAILHASSRGNMLASTTLPHPLTFEITNLTTSRRIYGGVKEFSSEENVVEMPSWMWDTLQLSNADKVSIKIVTLPKAQHLQLAPMTADYIEIPDTRALLESHIRSQGYTTLTVGEMLQVKSATKVYQFLVANVVPDEGMGGVCVIDTEPSVDIAPLDEQVAKDAVVIKHGLNGSSKVEKVIELAWQHGQGDDTSNFIQLSTQISRPQTYSIPTFPSTPYYTLAIQGNVDVYVGLEESPLPGPRDFSWCDVDLISKKNLQINCIPGEAEHVTVSPSHGAMDLSQSVSKTWPPNFFLTLVPLDSQGIQLEIKPSLGPIVEDVEVSHEPDQVECENCKQWIPQRTIQMHSAFCLRNNVPCKVCGKVLNKNQAQQHWHCEKCNFVTDEATDIVKQHHQQRLHTEMECECLVEESVPDFGHAHFIGLKELAKHRRLECPERLITCKYCHLKVRAGPIIITRNFERFTEHEEHCGSRTITCSQCGQAVRLKEVQHHGKVHELEKARKKQDLASGKGLGTLCSNQMCGRFIPEDYRGNPLGLCRACFGPFWIPTQDVGNQKLIQRLIATYHDQLTRTSECPAKSLCRNPWCVKSSSYQGEVLNPNDAAIKALDLAKQSKVMGGQGQVWLCTNDTKSQDRRVLAREMLMPMGGWKEELCVHALGEIERTKGYTGGDRLIDATISWLFENA